jgi:hypothetical protein
VFWSSGYAASLPPCKSSLAFPLELLFSLFGYYHILCTYVSATPLLQPFESSLAQQKVLLRIQCTILNAGYWKLCLELQFIDRNRWKGDKILIRNKNEWLLQKEERIEVEKSIKSYKYSSTGQRIREANKKALFEKYNSKTSNLWICYADCIVPAPGYGAYARG